jgi:hypothetical protein
LAPQRPQTLRLGAGSLALEASLRVWHGLWVGSGVGLSLLDASGPGSRAAGSDGMTLPFLSVHGRYAFDVGFGALAMGPDVALLPASREVRINGRALCTVPSATAGLVVELRLGG